MIVGSGRESGRYDILVEGVVDAKAVFGAVTADVVKTPDDKIMLDHALNLRRLLDRSALRVLWWTNSLDMIAEGMTKGSIDGKEILHLCRAGIRTCERKVIRWSSAVRVVAETA